jgi:hypothetical protein
MSRPQGTWNCRSSRKKPSVKPPGIDPGTHRLVAQRLNHYATPGPETVFDFILLLYSRVYNENSPPTAQEISLSFTAVSTNPGRGNRIPIFHSKYFHLYPIYENSSQTATTPENYALQKRTIRTPK